MTQLFICSFCKCKKISGRLVEERGLKEGDAVTHSHICFSSPLLRVIFWLVGSNIAQVFRLYHQKSFYFMAQLPGKKGYFVLYFI